MPRDFERRQTATRDEATAILRDVGGGIGAGSVRLGDGDSAIDVPREVDLEIEVEVEDDTTSLEL